MKRTVMASLSFVFLVVAGFVSLMFSGGFGGKMGTTISSVEQLASVFSLMSGEETDNCDSATVFMQLNIKTSSGNISENLTLNITMYVTKDVLRLTGIASEGAENSKIDMYQFLNENKAFSKYDDGDWEEEDIDFYAESDFFLYNEMFKDFDKSEFDIVNNIATLKQDSFDALVAEADINFSGYIKVYLANPNEPKLAMNLSFSSDSDESFEIDLRYTIRNINSTTVQIPAAIVDLRRAA